MEIKKGIIKIETVIAKEMKYTLERRWKPDKQETKKITKIK